MSIFTDTYFTHDRFLLDPLSAVSIALIEYSLVFSRAIYLSAAEELDTALSKLTLEYLFWLRMVIRPMIYIRASILVRGFIAVLAAVLTRMLKKINFVALC